MPWVCPPWPKPFFAEFQLEESHKEYLEGLSKDWNDVVKPRLTKPGPNDWNDYLTNFIYEFSMQLAIDDLFDREDVIKTVSASHHIDNWKFLHGLIRHYHEKRYDENVIMEFLELQTIQSEERFKIAVRCVRNIFEIVPHEEVKSIIKKLEDSNIDENIVSHAKMLTLSANFQPDFRVISPMAFMKVLTEMSPFMEKRDVCRFISSMFHLLLSPDKVISARIALSLARNAYDRECMYQTSFYMTTNPVFEYLCRQINEDTQIVLPRIELAVQLVKNFVLYQGEEVKKRDQPFFHRKMKYLTKSLTKIVETETDEKRKEYAELIRSRVRDFLDQKNQSDIDPPSFGTEKGVVSERVARRFLRYCDKDKFMYC